MVACDNSGGKAMRAPDRPLPCLFVQNDTRKSWGDVGLRSR